MYKFLLILSLLTLVSLKSSAQNVSCPCYWNDGGYNGLVSGSSPDTAQLICNNKSGGHGHTNACTAAPAFSCGCYWNDGGYNGLVGGSNQDEADLTCNNKSGGHGHVKDCASNNSSFVAPVNDTNALSPKETYIYPQSDMEVPKGTSIALNSTLIFPPTSAPWIFLSRGKQYKTYYPLIKWFCTLNVKTLSTGERPISTQTMMVQAIYTNASAESDDIWAFHIVIDDPQVNMVTCTFPRQNITRNVLTKYLKIGDFSINFP